MLTKIKVYACYTVKIYTKILQNFSNRGARARCAGPGSAFVRTIYIGVFSFTHIKVENLIHWLYNIPKQQHTFIFIFYNNFFLYTEKTAQLVTISLQIVTLYNIFIIAFFGYCYDSNTYGGKVTVNTRKMS